MLQRAPHKKRHHHQAGIKENEATQHLISFERRRKHRSSSSGPSEKLKRYICLMCTAAVTAVMPRSREITGERDREQRKRGRVLILNIYVVFSPLNATK
jgi:hypothetical protein